MIDIKQPLPHWPIGNHRFSSAVAEQKLRPIVFIAGRRRDIGNRRRVRYSNVQYPATSDASSAAIGGGAASLARNNNDGLVPVVLQQPVLDLASASLNLNNAGSNESAGRRLAYVLRTDNIGSDQTTTTMTTKTSCCHIMLQRCLVLLSLALPLGA